MTVREIKFAFSSNAFRKYAIIETIKILADTGYQGIEIMADVPHAYPPDLTKKDIQDIRNALDDYGMEISNINAFMLHAIGDTWHPSWIEKDPVQRKLRLDHTIRCLDLAEQLAAPSITTEPGGPLDGLTPQIGKELFLEGLDTVQETARKKGIRVLIEPEPGLLIENSEQFLDLFRQLDPTVFGLNFDIGHFFCVGEDPSALVTTLKDYICHFHLEDIAASRVHHHLMPGEGAIDLKDVLKAADEIGYRGFVTVELYTYEDQPVEAAQQAMKYLQEICGRIIET